MSVVKERDDRKDGSRCHGESARSKLFGTTEKHNNRIIQAFNDHLNYSNRYIEIDANDVRTRDKLGVCTAEFVE